MRSSGRGLFLVACVLGAIAAATTTACLDDGVTTTATPNGKGDASTPKTDSGPGDSGAAETGPGSKDAGSDAVEDAAPATDADSGAPTFTSFVETTGQIQMTDLYVQARFYQDDTVLRLSSLPECVTYLQSSNKPASNAGTLSVSTAFFGQDGGPPGTQIDINMGRGGTYISFQDGPPFFYPRTGALDVQIKTAGTPAAPALPLQTLKSPAFEQVRVTAPAKPDGGALTMMANQDFTVRWEVPAGGAANQKMIAFLGPLSDDAHTAVIRCGFPLSAGKAVFPAALLTRVRSGLTTITSTPSLNLLVGDQREVHVAGATYEIEVTRDATTDFGGAEVTLQ